MNLFFGKISQKVDIRQIEEGYYQAEKDSGWFGELQIGDYVYLIGGNRIQFWKASRWDKIEGKDCLYFDILNKDLGIGINEFIALKFFRITKSLLVLTSRSARKRAFFKIEVFEDNPVEELSKTEFYQNKELYRKIVYIDKNMVDPASSDIQIYSNEGRLQLYNANFFMPDVSKLFRDNLKYQGNGSTHKDNTLKSIQKALGTSKTVFSSQDISLRSFYDAFFCDYKNNDMEDTIIEVENKENQDKFLSEITEILKQKKNLIIQGAPGTGKTYRTAEIAVALCNGLDNVPDTRFDLMNEYKSLLEEGRVVFTTFHQSMDYEEFIEGIKPETSGEKIEYNVKNGLFKQICERAKTPIIINNDLQIRNNPNIWKVSLLGTGDNYIREDCMENNRIRIGWDQYGENVGDETNYSDGGKIVLDTFINKMQIGDIVMSCFTNKIVDAIGVVLGEYEWDDELSDFKRCRKVNWLIKNIKEDIYELNKETVMTLSTVYRLNNLSLENVMSILEKYNVTKGESILKNTKPYILIIDEINRGNISKIFGELITLLEIDKRLGEINEIKVRLPYTPQEEFGVPSNLYIIGTMNTADRSLGYIDYAIRRRFAFKTLQADKAVIECFNPGDDVLDKALRLFENIQNFITENIEHDLLADDLMLGHSYFLAKNINELRLKLEYEIIPLIKEYEKDGILTVDKNHLNQFCVQCTEML